MQTFTGKDYLRIDIANNFGLDKANWDDRIAWFNDNEHQLHSLIPQAEEPALFYAGILAWEAAKEGKPSGYPISLDATCSGIQLLAVLAGDRKAAEICNVVDTGKREDAYTSVYQEMADRIGESAKISRKDTKKAIMTSFYGSTAQPKNIFGDGELLQTFYDTIKTAAPGAWEINETMLAIWDPKALSNDWVLPDNFHVRVKIMGQVKQNVHFMNEPIEVTYHQNMPIKEGRSLGANMTHSVDALVEREMDRRCNFDQKKLIELGKLIGVGAKGRSTHRDQDKMVITLWDHYLDSGFLSARIIDYLDIDNLGLVDHGKILNLITSFPKRPFQVISVFDCFRCLPNYGNDLRQQYNNILADIADSELLSFIISQIMHRRIQVKKLDPNLGKDIRNSNYALS